MAVSDKITASMRRRLYFVIFAIMIACMVFVAFSMYKVAVKESKSIRSLQTASSSAQQPSRQTAALYTTRTDRFWHKA